MSTSMGAPVSTSPARRPLIELAEAHGVETEHTGFDGATHAADPDIIVAILAAMGVPIAHPDDAVEVLAAERRAPAPLIDPVIVQWTGRPTPVTVVLPHHVHPRDGWLELELENGERHRQRLLAAIVRPLLGTVVGGRQVDSYQLRIWHGPASPPSGYHRLRLEAPGIEASALVIVAPRCPRPKRGWGTFMPLHAVRAEADPGIGTYRHLGQLVAWTAEQGGSFVGTLPLFPTFLDGPTPDPSPYLPVTRLGWSEIHVDPTLLPEFDRTPEAGEVLRSAGVERSMAAARDSAVVDHASVMATLRSVLEPMARTLFADTSSRRDEFESFASSRPHLVPYARFRATRSGMADGQPGFLDAERYHLYVQWAAAAQLAASAGAAGVASTGGLGIRAGGAGAGLYLDLPSGVHPDGFDPIWEPEAFVPGIHGGAPPDDFFGGGQDWSFPPLDPAGLRQQEYRYLIACLRHAMGHADMVRIDHVMGLRRLYWIPEGSGPEDGVYVRYPAEEMRAVVALEAHRAGTAVIGEDLGTVPDEVRADMAHDGMLRSWVLQFETSSDEPLPTPPHMALASWGTHDLPPFGAFWDGVDIDERVGRGDLSPDEAANERAGREQWRHAVAARLGVSSHDPAMVLEGCLLHMATGPAQLVLVDLEDLWLERLPQNRPGTGIEAGNWRRRSARTLVEAANDPMVTATLSAIDRGRRTAPEPAAIPMEPGAGGAITMRRPE